MSFGSFFQSSFNTTARGSGLTCKMCRMAPGLSQQGVEVAKVACQDGDSSLFSDGSVEDRAMEQRRVCPGTSSIHSFIVFLLYTAVNAQYCAYVPSSGSSPSSNSSKTWRIDGGILIQELPLVQCTTTTSTSSSTSSFTVSSSSTTTGTRWAGAWGL
eukprot:s533_g12.t1